MELSLFDKKLPDYYKALDDEFRKHAGKRIDVMQLLEHQEPCSCDCNGCSDYCTGRIFEEGDESAEELQAQQDELEQKMLAIRDTKEALERWAKFKGIVLEKKR